MTDEPKFKVGDVVRSVFGGPEMTVTKPDVDGEVCRCVWWAKRENGTWAERPDFVDVSWELLRLSPEGEK